MGDFFDFGLSDLFGIGGDALTAAMMAEEGKKNREFQERMYKHRYQYATDDMRAAGINPILAAASGQPTTAGSMANVPHMGQGVGRNPGRRKFNAEAKLIKAKEFTEAMSAGALAAQKKLTEELTRKASADTATAQETARQSMFNREMLGRQHDAAMQLPDAFYLIDQGAQRLGPSANAVKNILLGVSGAAWGLKGGGKRKPKPKGGRPRGERTRRRNNIGNRPFPRRPGN